MPAPLAASVEGCSPRPKYPRAHQPQFREAPRQPEIVIVAAEHRCQLGLLPLRGVVLVVGEPFVHPLEKLALGLGALAADEYGAAILRTSPDMDESEKLESFRGAPLLDGLCPFGPTEAHLACFLGG